MKHTPANALMVGKIYDVEGYGLARYDGLLLPSGGWLWKFTACENSPAMQKGRPFAILYSALGINAAIAKAEGRE